MYARHVHLFNTATFEQSYHCMFALKEIKWKNEECFLIATVLTPEQTIFKVPSEIGSRQGSFASLLMT